MSPADFFGSLLPQQFGFLIPQQYPQREERPPAEATIPPRVKVAMEFLQRLSFKTGAVVVPGKGEFGACEVVEGQKLTSEEEQAMAAALALMSRYFGGDLKPTRWDVGPKAQRLQPLKIVCPVCQGKSGRCDTKGEYRHCNVCLNEGEVLVQRSKP